MNTKALETFDKLVEKTDGLLAQERLGEFHEGLHDLYDQEMGGHYINDKEAELALFKFTTDIFGKDGKLTKEQWAAQIDPFYDIIRPKTDWPYNGLPKESAQPKQLLSHFVIKSLQKMQKFED